MKEKTRTGWRYNSLFLALFALALIFAAATPTMASSIDDTRDSLKEVGIGGTSEGQKTTSGLPPGGIVVNCWALNVRSGPGTEHPVIGGLTSGAGITITGKETSTEGTTWWKIKYHSGEGFVSGKYIDTSVAKGEDKETAVNDTGVVHVNTSLNVRQSPWGNIEGSLHDGDKVDIIGKSGNWYKIKYNGKTSYVYADYVSKGEKTSDKKPAADDNNNNSAPSGDLQKRIVSAAESYIGSTSFRGPEVDGGNLACAQFVTTALKKAGALDRVQLGVLAAVSDLRAKGWKDVSAPPFKPGDVITWKTYDRNHDGAKDPDTHIGIIDDTGKAISNSSSLKMPRRNDIYYAPITRVMRKS